MRRVNLNAVAISIALTAAALTGCGQQPGGEAQAPAAAPAPAGDVTVFENARIIVGDGSAPIENGMLVVDGNTIVAAGANVQVPDGATHVDLTGKTVIPALIDTHVHLSQTREALTLDLRRRAYFGIGGAMSLGRDPDDLVRTRHDLIPGAARLFSSGRGITRPEPGRPDDAYWIETVDEGRQAVQELAALGVDIVKIWVDDRNGMYEKLTPEMYGAIIEEAHNNGLRVTAHIFNLEDAKGLLPAGLDAFAHGVRDMDIDDEFVAMFQQRPEVVLSPNLPERGVRTDLSWLQGSLPAEEYAALEAANVDDPDAQEFHGIQARNLARLNALGITIAIGTDGNTPWGPHVEMEDMVLAGLTPMQALVSATGNAATHIGADDIGTLAAGKSADFVVLDANPLDDIANTRQISSVYLRGEEVDRSAYP